MWNFSVIDQTTSYGNVKISSKNYNMFIDYDFHFKNLILHFYQTSAEY